VTVIGYFKLVKGEELLHLFLSVLFAFMGTMAVYSTFDFDRWNMKSFECLVKTNPIRSGRVDLVATFTALDENNSDIKISFPGAGYPKHPLNDLRPREKVYVEALFRPVKGSKEGGLGIHLERNGKILCSRDDHFKDQRQYKGLQHETRITRSASFAEMGVVA
jgi:hypothetical protein